MKLPDKYVAQMKELLKDDYQLYADSFNCARHYGLRVNTSKISVEDFLRISPFKLKKVSWTDDGFYYQEGQRPAKHPYYYAGLYYLQEPSAMLPGAILPVNENDFVLDGCAAPGGKSCQISCKLNGTGLLVSNDISASRAQGLLKNLELQGVTNSIVVSEDLKKLESRFNGFFDRILLDAPCSGEGMFRKDSALISAWNDKNGEYYSVIQTELASCAYNMLKEGGQMVYSTCTFNPEENEMVIDHLFKSHPEARLLPINKTEGMQDGLFGYHQAARLYPHKIDGEGHFAALIQKGEKTGERERTACNSPAEINEPLLKMIDPDFFKGKIIRIADNLLMTDDLIDTRGLRVLRSGLLLGRYKRDRFEPSQHLAMALKSSQFSQIIDLKVSDPRVISYLKCETIDVSDFNVSGWTLVCVDGYPLGFAKADNGIFKNHYDKNWRYI